MLEHFEYAYIMAKAWMLYEAAKEAMEKSEHFYPLDYFINLKSGFSVNATIKDIPDRKEKELIFSVTGPKTVLSKAAATSLASAFYEGAFKELPSTEGSSGHIDYSFVSEISEISTLPKVGTSVTE